MVNWSPPTSSVLSYQIRVRQYSVVNQRVETVDLKDEQGIVNMATINGLGMFSPFID